MKLVQDVFEIAESFMSDSKHVYLNESRIKEIGYIIKDTEKPTFPLPEVKNIFKGIILELVAGAVNYCYWYGKHNIRPCGSSSTFMYELLMNSFFDFEHPNQKQFEVCLTRFGEAMAIQRFPLLEERISHLNQLKEYGIDYCIMLENNHRDITYLFTELVEKFPGYASDVFLKRASLFFIQLFRRFGWFADELNLLHVPADYQVPKMLEYYSCIEYSSDLYRAITKNQHIPKTSLEECEIRAATIMAIKMLCEQTGWNVAEVDAFFFLKRHDTNRPFHLTVTTDY
jgi:hypothetical protein